MALQEPAVLFRDALAPAAELASLCCSDLRATWSVHDVASLNQALADADAACARGAYVVFALDYELGRILEPHVSDPSRCHAGHSAPLGYFWLFDKANWLTCAEADEWLMARASGNVAQGVGAAGADDLAGCLRGQPALSQAHYTEKISEIRQAIAAGDVYQVNFTLPLDVTLYGDPARVFLNLARTQPTSHAVYLDLPEYQVLSLSPELFFTVDGAQITVRPMKGTAPRAADAGADARAAAGLLASEKNRAENLMIVDLLRNDLGRVAVPGSVQVETLFEIEPYPTVHQMTSTISARLKTAGLADLIPALFPCGSVTGAPKVAAMQKIDALEIAPRGLYTGSVGWANADRIRANVAIRTLVLDPPVSEAALARSAVLGVGSGIVWDSDPEEEYAECLLKSAVITKPDPGFSLFETLRLELPAEDLAATLPLVELFPRYRLHRDRLQASAAALGFGYDEAAFEAILWQVKAEIRQKQCRSPGGRLYRVRVDLSHGGGLRATWSALPPLADRVALIWSAEVLEATDPLLRHKVSARIRYDAAVDMAVSQQAFDALFCNAAGQVCEGARSNVFVREGQRLLTPPLRCGLLPGVLRTELLATGAACESLLTVADIKAASREGRLRVGNALRGLMPAYLK